MSSIKLRVGIFTLIATFAAASIIVLLVRSFDSFVFQSNGIEAIDVSNAFDTETEHSCRISSGQRREICDQIEHAYGLDALKKQPVDGGVLNHRSCMADPVYPEAARETLVSGKVNVEVIVDGRGIVRSAKVVSGPELLRNAAVKAAFRTRVAPTWLRGEPVNVKGTLIYYFDLTP